MIDEQPGKSPEAAPEVGPEAPGSRWLTMPAIGVLLGMSERAARDWVRRHNLPIHGSRPMRVSEQAVLAQMAAEERVARKSPEVIPEVPGSPGAAPGSVEPIEAAYRVAGEAAAEVALVPLATMVEELRGLADQLAELARRNEALALEVGTLRERQVGHEREMTAKDQALAADALTIAELRRRAEHAETELARRREEEAGAGALLRRRVEQERRNRAGMQDGPEAPGAPERPQEARRGVWPRLRRWWRG